MPVTWALRDHVLGIERPCAGHWLPTLWAYSAQRLGLFLGTILAGCVVHIIKMMRGEANSGAGIFDDINGLKPYIYLYLPKNQEVMKGEFDYNSNQYIWKPTGESYFASYDYDNRIFLGYQFQRVMS